MEQESAVWSTSFRKSTYSNASAECLEVASYPTRLVAVRDSKDVDGCRLLFSAGGWQEFVGRVRGGAGPRLRPGCQRSGRRACRAGTGRARRRTHSSTRSRRTPVAPSGGRVALGVGEGADMLARLKPAQVTRVRGRVAQHQRRGACLIRADEARSGNPGARESAGQCEGDAAAARDHVVGAWVADHHAIDVGRGRVLEERPRPAEGTSVLVHVQQQRHAGGRVAFSCLSVRQLT